MFARRRLLSSRRRIVYLLRDEFITAAAAPLASPRNCEPGPGQLTLVQTDGQFSIANGKLQVPTQATPVVGDLGFYGRALARKAGRVLLTGINFTNVSGANFPNVGWSRSASPVETNWDAQLYLSNSTFGIAISNAANPGAVAAAANNTDYQIAIVHRPTGFYYFIRGGAFGAWTLVWVTDSTTTAQLYPAFDNYTGVGTMDFIRAYDVGAPFTSDALADLDVAMTSQSLGSDLIVNGNMETGSPPSSWTPSANASITAAADERTGGAGAQSLQVTRDTSGAHYAQNSATVTQHKIYEGSCWLKNVDAGVGVGVFANGDTIGFYGAGSGYYSGTSWIKTKKLWRNTAGAGLNIRAWINTSAGGQSGKIDEVEVKEVTVNAAQTVNPDALLHATFTLPSSPVTGDQIHLIYRMTASGQEFNNAIHAIVRRNDANTQWDVFVNKYVGGTATTIIGTTSNVGNVDAIAIIANGASHDLYTRVGAAWLKRGATGTAADGQWAVLANVVYTSGFTNVRLISYPLRSLNYYGLEVAPYKNTYLLRDEFITPAAAPLSSPRTSMVGSLTLVQNDGQFSVSGGKLQIPAQSTPAFGDLGLYSATFARTAGRAFIYHVNLTTASGNAIYMGLGDGGGANYSNIVSDTSFIIISSNVYVFLSSGGTLQLLSGAITTATDFWFALVMRAGGAYLFIKGGTFTNWTLLWMSAVGTAASGVLLGSQSNAGVSNLIRVIDLPAPFATDALAQINITSATQSLGAELLTNGDFSAWTGDNPNSWTILGESGSNPMVTQVDPSGSAGTGAARYYANTGNFIPDARQTILTVGAFYEAVYECTAYVSGSHAFRPSAGWSGNSSTSTGVKKALIRAGATAISLTANSNAVHDFTLDNATVKQLTINAAQTIDTSSIIDFTFTLPASPVAGDQVHLCYRISASGEEFNNCYDAYLIRNDANTQWDFKMDSISGGTRTNRVSATGVGNVTTIRVIAFGNNHDCYTLVGAAWTKRGATINNASFNTAVLVNTIYTSGFTFGSLVSYPVASANYDALRDV